MSNLTYEDLEDLLVEKDSCIKRLRRVGKDFRYGWSNDEAPHGPLSVARRDVDDQMRAIMESFK